MSTDGPPVTPKNGWTNRLWFWPTVAGCLAAIVLIPLLGWGFTFDQGVFSTIADTMLRGGVVYRDAWEHKPPGVFYIYYLAFILIHRDIWAVRILELLAIAISTAGLFRLAERRCGSRAAGAIASACLPLSYLSLGQNTAQAESFQIPLIIGALLVWPEFGVGRRIGARCFLSGVLIGIGAMFKTPLVALALVFPAEALIQDRGEKGLKKLRNTMLCGSGMALPLGLLFAYYGARGAAEEFFDALFIYPARYASVGLDRTLSSQALEAVAWTTWLIPISWSVLMVLGFVHGWRVRRRETFLWAVMFLASWGVVIIQGRYFPYHHLPMLPTLAWGAGLLFSRGNPMTPAEVARPLSWQTIVGGALAGAMLIQCCQHIRRQEPRFGRWAAFDRDNGITDLERNWIKQRDAARYLRLQTRPDDRIFIWGDQPLVYAMSDRRMAGPNSHLMQVVPNWGGTERLLPLIERLMREKPRIILITPDWLWWRGNQTPKELLSFFPDMHGFLTRFYRRTDQFDGYEAWTLED